MKLAVFSPVFNDKTLAQACEYLVNSGVYHMEMGCGGHPGKTHCDAEKLLNNPSALKEFTSTLEEYGIEVDTLSVHGNPVHPIKEIADSFHKDFEKAVLLAEKLGIKRIVTFSGCPGGSKHDITPNWITCPWPEDFSRALDYQWNEILIPYWQKTSAWAVSHGIEKIAFEMHPGFCVYNPETMLKIRKAVGPILGANFDPSHLFWQGINPIAAIRELGEAIYFFHAKDTKIDLINTEKNGVLDTKHYGDEINRSWIFRSVGYGHDYMLWKDIISNLRLVGYDDTISIEHEDSLMSSNEGLQKAISFLKEILVTEDAGKMFWA